MVVLTGVAGDKGMSDVIIDHHSSYIQAAIASQWRGSDKMDVHVICFIFLKNAALYGIYAVYMPCLWFI